VRILLMGDVMLGRLVNQALKTRDAGYVWGDTLPLLSAADLRACNLECVLSSRGRPWSVPPKVFHFRSDAKNVAVLSTAGIDIVSLANNHVLDYEYEALLDMLEILERSGINYCGAGRNREEARRPARVERQGIRVAMVAATDNEPGWEAAPGRPGTFYVPTGLRDRRVTELQQAVSRLAQDSGFVIVSLHWGPNWGYEPPQEHVELGRALIEAGADAVFGHSPHVFRGIEFYRRKPILYSAGDFIDDYAVDEVERNDESFVFAIEAQAHEVGEISLYPTVISRFQARRADPRTAAAIAAKMQALCEKLGTRSWWSAGEQSLFVAAPGPASRAA
jgi:poly-gamma-glutamate capsule biosynthesis protein CapA/YwtB (metallophosphatase superfamily)